MTKYDFRIRRGVFRSGNIKSHRDFQRFEKGYRTRKHTETRLRNLIIMIAIIIITIVLIFTVRALSATDSQYRHELKVENVKQIL